MKQLIVTVAFLLVTTVISTAQTTPFEKFDKSRIDVGTMYVYEYSRNKGYFEPSSTVYLYVKTVNDLEIMKVTKENKISTGIERYMMNWNYMMLEKSDYISFKDKNDMLIGETSEANASIDFLKKTIKNKYTNKTKDGFRTMYYEDKIKSIPVYFYNMTDLIDLWFPLRFYPLGKKDISVTVSGMNYEVDCDIKFEGKEKVDVPFGKILCYKFELIPQLSFFMKLLHSPKKAFIWLTSENLNMYMVKYINNNRRSTFTQSMEYRLADIKKMSIEEWEKFKSDRGVNIK